jgi:hypothetical protein
MYRLLWPSFAGGHLGERFASVYEGVLLRRVSGGEIVGDRLKRFKLDEETEKWWQILFHFNQFVTWRYALRA